MFFCPLLCCPLYPARDSLLDLHFMHACTPFSIYMYILATVLITGSLLPIVLVAPITSHVAYSSGFPPTSAHNVSLVPWRKLSGNSNGIKSGSFRHFVAFGLCFRHACLCDGAPILSAMATPAKVRNVSTYRVARICDEDGALRRKAEITVYSVTCSIPVTASLFSRNCYSRARFVAMHRPFPHQLISPFVRFLSVYARRR